jgi:hypothetical protein
MRTFVRVCDTEACDAYVIPQRHNHPAPYGKPNAGGMLSDPVHAGDAARAAGWDIGIKVATDKWIDLCPPCAEARRAKKAEQTDGGAS